MNYFFDLSHFALLEISGDDARDFLHNQITADLSLLEQREWLYSAWCMPNGRVICTFLLFQMNNNFYLLLPSMLGEKIIKRLSMFILRSKVSIRDCSEDFTVLGFCGDSLHDFMNNLTTDISGKNIILESNVRYIVIISNEYSETLYEKIDKQFREGTRSQWSLLDIEAGIPWITFNSSEQYLPQMLNLDNTDGLSYKKGCYPGQEIIARLHYRGEVKKLLFRGTVQGHTTPGTGDKICDKSSNTVIGEILDAEPTAENTFRFLAVCEKGSDSNRNLSLTETDCQSLTLQPV